MTQIALEDVVIKNGSHSKPRKKTANAAACAMEWVSIFANEDFGDHPQCACPVIAAFVRRFNDSIRDDARRTELLRPLIPILIGTRATIEIEKKRAWLAADWAVRVKAPIYLRLVPKLVEHADALAALPEFKDLDSYDAARETIVKVRNAAYAADAADEIGRARAEPAAIAASQSSAVDLIRRMCAVA